MTNHNIKNTDVSRETLSRIKLLKESNREALNEYVEKLLWWNKKINLVSRGLNKAEAMQHVEHSLWLTAVDEVKNAKSIVDAGSGGGLPGIPLAIANPELKVVLVDIVEKKMMTAEAIARAIKLRNVQTKHISIGDYIPDDDAVLVTKHAFKIPDIIDFVKGKGYSKIVMLKGVDFVEEIRDMANPPSIDVIQIFDYDKSQFYEGKCILKVNLNE
ncbi:MAG: class I SAM-dependent methyltransferase [Balneolales bacterium]|nr:class I SAM-dependent methyltransferase [Balneolales bacterium]